MTDQLETTTLENEHAEQTSSKTIVSSFGRRGTGVRFVLSSL